MMICRVLTDAAILACMAGSSLLPDGPASPDTPRVASRANVLTSADAAFPVGAGSVAEGVALMGQRCTFCHGGTLGAKHPNDLPRSTGASNQNTSGQVTALDVFRYVSRTRSPAASPDRDGSATYAVTAYLLHINGVVGPDTVLDAGALNSVHLPGRDAFIVYWPAGSR